MYTQNFIVAGGYPTTPIELSVTENGKSFCAFTLSMQRKLTYEQKKNPNIKKYDYIRVAVWGTKAEFLTKYYRKGMAIEVTGKIESTKHVDKSTKEATYLQQINAETVQMFMPKTMDEINNTKPVAPPTQENYDSVGMPEYVNPFEVEPGEANINDEAFEF